MRRVDSRQAVLPVLPFEPWVVAWDGRRFEARPAAAVSSPVDRYLPESAARRAAETLTAALYGGRS